jgi:predicted N-formylglutamate amidohydrolase
MARHDPSSLPSPLLAADEPEPVWEENAGGRSPFLFTCDHAGNLIPKRLGDLGVSAAERERHIAWDIGIAGVARRLAHELDAHLVGQTYSRLVIDCNRPPGVAASIPVVSEATQIPGNENLSEEDRLARRQAIFDPYHARIAAVLDARAARTTFLVALHSFTPVYLGAARPWHIGTLYWNKARTDLPQLLLALLREEEGLVVGDNQPYDVTEITDYAIPVHGEGRGLANTGIEIRQDLIATDAGQAEWADRLARIFRGIERRLIAQ